MNCRSSKQTASAEALQYHFWKVIMFSHGLNKGTHWTARWDSDSNPYLVPRGVQAFLFDTNLPPTGTSETRNQLREAAPLRVPTTVSTFFAVALSVLPQIRLFHAPKDTLAKNILYSNFCYWQFAGFFFFLFNKQTQFWRPTLILLNPNLRKKGFLFNILSILPLILWQLYELPGLIPSLFKSSWYAFIAASSIAANSFDMFSSSFAFSMLFFLI